MTGPGWDNEAWQQVGDYERFWTPFDATFHFRPGISPATWPAIAEPAASITLDLGPVFSRGDGQAADEDALNRLTLDAMTAVFPDGTKLIALSWQHTSFWFWPHRQTETSEPWRITPFPHGDYHIFLTEDLTQGTFGHPWEQTFCVFGPDLVDTLVPTLADWLPEKRRN